MPGDTVHPESRRRLLRDPGVRAEQSGGDSVVAVVLAQRRGFSGTRPARATSQPTVIVHACRRVEQTAASRSTSGTSLSRPAHRSHDDHHG